MHRRARAGLAYLAGSIPTGWLVARLYNVDIQQSGSGNIGATNVFRVLGMGPGIFVLLVDAAKGLIPCQAFPGMVISWFFDKGVTVPEFLPAFLPIVAGVGAILGHIFTPWLRFKGGKGVATASGVFAVLSPVATIVAVVAFTLVVARSRFVSLGSIVATITLPMIILSRLDTAGLNSVYPLTLILIALTFLCVEAVRLIPPKILSLEQAIAYIADDELVEATPTAIRIRKRLLKENDRKRESRRESA